MQTQKVDIPVNVPIPVTLASLDGVIVKSNYGAGQQFKFTTPDGKALYVPTWVGDQVKALGSRNIRLTKAQDAQRKINWKVEKVEGEQSDGTFVIKTEKPGSTPSQVTEPGLSIDSQSSLQSNQILPEPQTARKRILWDAGRELVDAHAALMKYATEKHPGVLTSYDVRTYLVTTFINASGKGQGGRR